MSLRLTPAVLSIAVMALAGHAHAADAPDAPAAPPLAPRAEGAPAAPAAPSELNPDREMRMILALLTHEGRGPTLAEAYRFNLLRLRVLAHAPRYDHGRSRERQGLDRARTLLYAPTRLNP